MCLVALSRRRVPFGQLRNFARHTHHVSSPKCTTQDSDGDYEDFYRYTSGRWVWKEEERLQERYKRFNVSGLKHLAAKVAGARSCLGISKLGEGGYNKVFSLSMDDGSSIIARIPMPTVGPSVEKVIASEVATMDFVRNVIHIPVPKVLSWSGSTDNEAGSEYILMEYAKGTQLVEQWADMEIDEKNKVVEDLVDMERKLMSVSFQSYGSLYFACDASSSCADLGLSGEIPSSVKQYAEERYIVGPVAEKQIWDVDNGSSFDDRGPWRNAQDYLEAIARREMSKTPSPMDQEQQHRLSLLHKFITVRPYLLPREAHLDRPALRHWDLRAPNIFVEDTRITTVIDWQDVWAVPLLMHENRPQLIQHDGEIMMKLPESYETMENENEKKRICHQVERTLLAYAYEQETRKQNKDSHDVLMLPLAHKRRQMIDFASDIWNNPVVPLRECLIQLEKYWDELETGAPCPIHFTAEEIEAHELEIPDSARYSEIIDAMDGFIAPDGFTANEDYEEALKFFNELTKKEENEG